MATSRKRKKTRAKKPVSDLRKLFPHEANDFTVWLEQNITTLSDCVGIPLTVEQRELPIGRFRADLVCRDFDGNRVLIENQLEKTDHDHLGKAITYVMNVGASTMIWVTPEPQAAHVTTIEELNSRFGNTDKFFMVRVETVWNNGELVPQFSLIAGPEVTVTPAETTPDDELDEVQITAPNDSRPLVWCIHPAHDEQTYKLFLYQGVIGIDFSNLGNLAKIEPTFAAVREKWTQKNRFQNANQAKVFASMMHRFAHQAQPGHLIVYPPTWHEPVVHIGRITGPYRYERWKRYSDLHNVEWLTKIDRQEFSKEALRGISVNLAFFRVRNEAFQKELFTRLAD